MTSRDELAVEGSESEVFAPYRRVALQHVFWLCAVAALGLVDTVRDAQWRMLDLVLCGVAALVLYFLPLQKGPWVSEMPELPGDSMIEAAWRSAFRTLLDTQVLGLLAMAIGGIFLSVAGAIGAGAAISQIAEFLRADRRLRDLDGNAIAIFLQLNGPWFVPGVRHARWYRAA